MNELKNNIIRQYNTFSEFNNKISEPANSKINYTFKNEINELQNNIVRQYNSFSKLNTKMYDMFEKKET